MSSNVVRKKKKWGKIYSYTPIKRDILLDEETSKEIETALKKKNSVFTPVSLAQRFSIRVSLAKKVLNYYVEKGDLTLVFNQAGQKVYKS